MQKTLLDAGVAGFADGVEDEIAVTIYYDFSPTQSDKSWTCPLLLSDPITVQLRVPEAVGTKLKTGTKAGGEAAEGFYLISHQASSSLGFRAPKPAVPEASAAAEPEIEGAPA